MQTSAGEFSTGLMCPITPGKSNLVSIESKIRSQFRFNHIKSQMSALFIQTCDALFGSGLVLDFIQVLFVSPLKRLCSFR